jgi:sRNA-binding carbon storage regulator CsrA
LVAQRTIKKHASQEKFVIGHSIHLTVSTGSIEKVSLGVEAPLEAALIARQTNVEVLSRACGQLFKPAREEAIEEVDGPDEAAATLTREGV